MSSRAATTKKPPKKVFTTGIVGKIVKVAPRTVSKWFDSGRLKGYRIPGSQDRRIPREQLIRFLKESGMPVHWLYDWEISNNFQVPEYVTGELPFFVFDTQEENSALHNSACELLCEQGYKPQIVRISNFFELGLQCVEQHVLVFGLLVAGNRPLPFGCRLLTESTLAGHSGDYKVIVAAAHLDSPERN